MKDIDVFWTGLPTARPSSFGSWPDYSDPNEILFSSELSVDDKREILSSWASDARAVPGRPAQRRLDNGATVKIDDILEALKKLDAPGTEVCRPKQKDFATHWPRGSSHKWRPATLRVRRPNDDDDDPPPCPAMISPFPRLPIFGAESVLEAA